MNPLGQAALLFSLCVAGNLLSALAGGALPGNVIGMVLLLALLLRGWIRPRKIDALADFFLDHMAFFFLPSTLGILRVFDQVKSQLPKLVLVCVITTFLTAAAAGGAVVLARRLLRKENAK